MPNTIETTEKRQMGALAIFFREFGNAQQVLLIKDERKTETSAGLGNKWYRHANLAYNFPGGGRQEQNGKSETLPQTLKREVEEEMKSFVALKSVGYEKQIYPFIVGQLKEIGVSLKIESEPQDEKINIATPESTVKEKQKKKKTIDEFAVTSALFQWDNLSLHTQRKIDTCVKEETAIWLDLYNLALIFCLQREKKGTQFNNGRLFRPQSLTAAYIWTLEKFMQQDAQKLIKKIETMNQSTHNFIYEQANDRRISVNNGAFTSEGSLIPKQQMSLEDRTFILRPSKRSKRK